MSFGLYIFAEIIIGKSFKGGRNHLIYWGTKRDKDKKWAFFLCHL